MTTVFQRLKAVLPQSWFPDDTPVLDALLLGLSSGLEYVYSVFSYAKLQTRIKTATDGWLDLIAQDYFGNSILRQPSQSDASFKALILASLFRERATRKGLNDTLVAVTGRAPRIVEPQRVLDTGVYRGPYIAYGRAGAYGSLHYPGQVFVTAYRPAGNFRLGGVAGYGSPTGGFGKASEAEYLARAAIVSDMRDSDIYTAINQTKPVGVIAWTRISS